MQSITNYHNHKVQTSITSTMSQTICFFGATGGCTNACLTAALNSGSYQVIALARTPEKLRNQLITQQKLDEEVVDKNLTIVQGNALELADVKRTLLTRVANGSDTSLPFMLVCGLGGTPNIAFDIRHPLAVVRIDNPTICEDAAKTLITALKEIYAEQPALANDKPNLTFVSTTGITRGPEDVPLSMRFLYHQMLAIPHADKKKQDDVYRDQLLEPQPVFTSVTGIRPTLLMGSGILNEGIGLDKIRAGVESNPETGFTIQRADVGDWIFENVVKGAENMKWRGEMCSLTS